MCSNISIETTRSKWLGVISKVLMSQVMTRPSLVSRATARERCRELSVPRQVENITGREPRPRVLAGVLHGVAVRALGDAEVQVGEDQLRFVARLVGPGRGFGGEDEPAGYPRR